MWKQRLICFGLGVTLTLMGVLVADAVFKPGLTTAVEPQNSYRIYAEFNNVGTLTTGSRVAMAGVTIGRVTRVTLDNDSYRAHITMAIRNNVDNIAVDSTAVIMTAGLLGRHYIEISPGGHPESVSNNGYIEDTQSAISLERLILRRISGG